MNTAATVERNLGMDSRRLAEICVDFPFPYFYFLS